VQSRIERERRIRELRHLVQAGLFRVDVDRLARAIVQRSQNKLRARLDAEPAC
jgi:anti-sigma28 factor (negative regulator of flagellin synthesis)